MHVIYEYGRDIKITLNSTENLESIPPEVQSLISSPDTKLVRTVTSYTILGTAYGSCAARKITVVRDYF